MDTKRLAQALNTIALGFAEAAEALNDAPGLAGAVGRADVHSPGVPSASPTDQGHLSVCPKHKSSYLPSKFQEGTFYCPADSDDPAWSNAKGKCRITPDNAAEYLRIRAAA